MFIIYKHRNIFIILLLIMAQSNKEVRIYIKYYSDKPTQNKKYNIHLVKFLKSHIDLFNKAGYYMDIILCDGNKVNVLSQLKHKHGINTLPVLILAGRPNKIYGVSDIKTMITKLCRFRISSTQSNDELVQGHQARCMMPDEDEEDDPYVTPFDDVAKATAEWQRRQEEFNEYDGNDAKGRKSIRNNRKSMGHRGPYGNPQGNRNKYQPAYDDDEYQEQHQEQQGAYENYDRGRVKMRDNPADIQRTLPGGDSRDNDLMAQFWENNEETKM